MNEGRGAHPYPEIESELVADGGEIVEIERPFSISTVCIPKFQLLLYGSATRSVLVQIRATNSLLLRLSSIVWDGNRLCRSTRTQKRQ